MEEWVNSGRNGLFRLKENISIECWRRMHRHLVMRPREFSKISDRYFHQQINRVLFAEQKIRKMFWNISWHWRINYRDPKWNIKFILFSTLFSCVFSPIWHYLLNHRFCKSMKKWPFYWIMERVREKNGFVPWLNRQEILVQFYKWLLIFGYLCLHWKNFDKWVKSWRKISFWKLIRNSSGEIIQDKG